MANYGEYEIVERIDSSADAVIEKIGDAEIAITNKAPITKEVIDSCPNLKFVSVLATGYNIVDVKYAHEKGITVCNVPAYSTNCTSQYAIALMLEKCL